MDDSNVTYRRSRRLSGFFESSSPAKRQKVNLRRRSSSEKEDLNKAFIETFNDLNLEHSPTRQLKTIGENSGTSKDKIINNVKKHTSKKLSKKNECWSSKSNSCSAEDVANFLINATLSKSNKRYLNTAFIDVDTIEDQKTNSIHKTRRLSGLFPRKLNTGFLENSPSPNKENNNDIVFVNATDEGPKAEENCNNNSNSLSELLTENISNTPYAPRTRLRNRRNQEPSHESIVRIYTDKTVKKSHNSLETIFETPTSQLMTSRKLRRFINFSERMSNAKLKKRHARIVKYQLWENINPISPEYFTGKLTNLEAYL